jgi:succinate dehydrogenase / fumarate reductase membrane anchor subunit
VDVTSEIQAAAAAGTTPAESAADAEGVNRPTGSAGEGAHHWWQERLASLSTLLLFVWFAVSLLRLPAYDHATIVEWLSAPSAAVPMLLLVASTFWHIKLGLQVVVEDYVHDAGNKLFALVLINFAVALGAAFAFFAVLKIALGAGGAAG